MSGQMPPGIEYIRAVCVVREAPQLTTNAAVIPPTLARRPPPRTKAGNDVRSGLVYPEWYAYKCDGQGKRRAGGMPSDLCGACVKKRKVLH